MIGYLMVGTNDLTRSLAFYDAVFAPLGFEQTDDSGRYVGYGPPSDGGGESVFYVTGPYDGREATAGNGTMIAFPTPSMAMLERVYRIALESGGIDEGAPGRRLDYSATHYAYVRDPDGNKLAFYCDNVDA